MDCMEEALISSLNNRQKTNFNSSPHLSSKYIKIVTTLISRQEIIQAVESCEGWTKKSGVSEK